MIVSIVDAHDELNYIYVQYKRGEIEIWDRDTGAYVTTFMTLPFPILNSDGEAGFTSLVFHPNYKQNGRFFVVSLHSCVAVIFSRLSVLTLHPSSTTRRWTFQSSAAQWTKTAATCVAQARAAQTAFVLQTTSQ